MTNTKAKNYLCSEYIEYDFRNISNPTIVKEVNLRTHSINQTKEQIMKKKDKLTEQVDTDLLDFHSRLTRHFDYYYAQKERKGFEDHIYDLKENNNMTSSEKLNTIFEKLDFLELQQKQMLKRIKTQRIIIRVLIIVVAIVVALL